MKEKSSIYAYARSLRQNQTPAESMIWKRVRNKQLDGNRIRRQHPIGRIIIADFYCPAARLIIEIDGGVHDLKDIKEHDLIREKKLLLQNYHIIRFKNQRVFTEIEKVIAEIVAKSNSLTY